MPISTTDLIELDTSEVKVLGKSLATIARESPKTVRMALGRQVRNTQKSIAATVRNYALRSKVEGKRTTLARFPKRHPITVSLHGKKGGGKLGDNRAVSVTRGGNEFAVGYKGGLTPFAERWQTGGKVGLYRDSAANHIRTRLFKPQWDALMQDPAFQWRVYRVLGRLYDIHTPEELEAASGDSAGPAHAILRSMVFKRLREDGEALLENPRTWKGRPFFGVLADDVRKRFVPSVASILEKELKKELPQ